MEEQNKSTWPVILLTVFVVLAVIAGFVFYPREERLVSETSGIDLYQANTNTQTMSATSTENIILTVSTNQGVFKIELYADQAPQTVKNFVDLAEKGFYNGILFHRVIAGFMIQGGDPLTKTDPDNWNIHGTGGPGYKFADEQNDLKLERGVIAMANSGPNTNGSQFFIMTAREPLTLQGYYTAFGRVIEGMETIDKIEAVAVNERDHPLEDMKILKIEK